MGRIVQKKSVSLGILSYAAAACLVVGFLGGYLTYSTKEITVTAGVMGIKAMEEMIKDEGGRILSMKKEGDKYKMRVFTFRRMNFFLEGLSEKALKEGAEVE